MKQRQASILIRNGLVSLSCMGASTYASFNEAPITEFSPLSQAVQLLAKHTSLTAEDKKVIEFLPVLIQQIVTKNNYSINTKMELELSFKCDDISHTLKALGYKLSMLELITPNSDVIISQIGIVQRAVTTILELETLESGSDPLIARACNTNALLEAIREKINSLRQLIIAQFIIIESLIENIVGQNCCAELNSKLDILISKIDFILTASCDCTFF